MVKKRTIRTILIIILVMAIAITAPAGSYINSITQSNQVAYAENQLWEKTVGFIKVMLLPMLAMSALKQSAMTVNESLTSYVYDKVEEFAEISLNRSMIFDSLGAYGVVHFAMKQERIDQISAEDIETYVNDKVTEYSNQLYMDTQLMRIAMMEARMDLASGFVEPSEIFQFRGIREIAALFINFFTNQLILDGYITLESEEIPASLYQQWEGYPDSPFLTTDYPYQHLTAATDTFLYVSVSPIVFVYAAGTYYKINTNPSSSYIKTYKLIDSEWIYQTQKATDVIVSYGTYQTNHDIYDFRQTTPTILYAKNTSDELGLTYSIDEFIEDTESIPVYPIAANPTYDPASEDPADHVPFVAPVPGIDTPTGDLTLSPGTVAPDGTITRDIEGVTETVNNVDVQVDVRVDTATMEELLKDIADNTDAGTNFRVPNLPNFLNLLLLVLINIFKFVLGFLALVVAFRGIPATNYLLTDPNLVATINWWKTVNIPGFNLNLMQIITGFLVIMTLIRLLAILRSFIAKRAVYFSTEIEKGKIFDEDIYAMKYPEQQNQKPFDPKLNDYIYDKILQDKPITKYEQDRLDKEFAQYKRENLKNRKNTKEPTNKSYRQQKATANKTIDDFLNGKLDIKK